MSDILIKNMELPKEGGLVIEITKHGQVAQLFKDGSLLRKGVKAIELPPHGELVDRSKMKGAMYEIMQFPVEEACAMYEELIEEAPTVLEAST